MDEREQVKQLLDTHYGDHRTDETKEEIIDFIENNIGCIMGIYADWV